MDSAILREESLKLPTFERAQLADTLLLSLSDDVPEGIMNSWAHESEDRLAAFREGRIEAIEGKKVIDALRQKLA